MSDTAPLLPPDETPAPLQGCLICHAEGTLELQESRPLPVLGPRPPRLICSNCGSQALLEWRTGQVDWRIQYKSISPDPSYHHAQLRFGNVGWLSSDEALDLSTAVYIHRQRLTQVNKGDLSWLKPQRLDPPPPLMKPDEQVYLTLKATTFGELLPSRIPTLLPSKVNSLDTGTFYITNSKIHLLGQRRDRSHRLSEIQQASFQKDQWRVELTGVGQENHLYQGLGLADPLDAELITAIIKQLVGNYGH